MVKIEKMFTLASQTFLECNIDSDSQGNKRFEDSEIQKHHDRIYMDKLIMDREIKENMRSTPKCSK